MEQEKGPLASSGGGEAEQEEAGNSWKELKVPSTDERIPSIWDRDEVIPLEIWRLFNTQDPPPKFFEPDFGDVDFEYIDQFVDGELSEMEAKEVLKLIWRSRSWFAAYIESMRCRDQRH